MFPQEWTFSFLKQKEIKSHGAGDFQTVFLCLLSAMFSLSLLALMCVHIRLTLTNQSTIGTTQPHDIPYLISSAHAFIPACISFLCGTCHVSILQKHLISSQTAIPNELRSAITFCQFFNCYCFLPTLLFLLKDFKTVMLTMMACGCTFSQGLQA